MIRVVVEILTSHNHLSNDKYATGKIGSPERDRCEKEKEDALHYLCECEVLARQRTTTLGQAELKLKDVRELTVGHILEFYGRSH